MRRLLIAAALTVALALPAQATAKSKHYTGTVNPSGTVSFKTLQKRHSKKKRVSGFSFFGVPVSCSDGAHTASGVVTTPAKLKAGRFNISAVNRITGAALEIHGSLRTGTIRLSGSVAIEPSGTGSNCSSGVLGWTAHRG